MLHLDMGKYAMFVWPAWGLSVLVLGAVVVDTLMRARRAKAALDRAEAGQ